jgi:hypothetical protein
MADRVSQVFGHPSLLSYPWPALYVVVMLVGCVALWGRRGLVLVSMAPLAVTLLAASAQQYPFAERLILFLVLGVLLGVAAGISWLSGAAAYWHRRLGASVVRPSCFLLPTPY